MRKVLGIIVLLALAAGCARTGGDERRRGEAATPVAAAASATFTPVATPSLTPAPTAAGTSTATASPAALPTITATPTPTAVPLTVVGDPRGAALRPPAAQEGAVCGQVDLFDFPLNAPHGRDAARGWSDFGVYREEYDGYHAGEDWWASGRRSLGAPVYSIGHGQVTYAEASGWGRDKGVIIVRHILEDGRELLSFYGHLDEESLKVEAGDCVTRGEQIAEIGRPTTSPHLHFELRTVMPYAPGRGYLPDDPALMGWEPPSATIWNSRMAASPGVLWSKSFAGEGLRSVDLLGDELIVVLDGDQLRGIDTADGSERWQFAAGEDAEYALLDAGGRQIYTANQFGEIAAFVLPDQGTTASRNGALPLWTVDLDIVGLPALLPLPGGGLLLSARDRLAAVSAQGEPLWEAELGTRSFEWLAGGDALIISTTGSEPATWTADARGLSRWNANVGGHLAASGDNVLLYFGNMLYRLDLESQSVTPLLALPRVSAPAGEAAALAGGGAIISHFDPFDKRLIAVDGDGTILWQRSIAGSVSGNPQLLANEAGQRLLLAARNSDFDGSEVSIFSLDTVGAAEEARLVHLFTGGTRANVVGETRLFDLGNGRILINIDGRSLTLLDTSEAEKRIIN